MSTATQSASAGAELADVRELFREYVAAVREHFGERVTQIWLYGSAARGDWTPESDIDVLVLLSREEPDDMEWLVRTAYRMGLSERHLLLQPVMLTQDEFDQLLARERRFAREVVEQGIAA